MVFFFIKLRLIPDTVIISNQISACWCNKNVAYKKHVILLCSLLNIKKQLSFWGLFLCLSTVEGGMFMPCKLSFQNGCPELQCVAWNQPVCATCRICWSEQSNDNFAYISEISAFNTYLCFFIIYGKKFRKRKSKQFFIPPFFCRGGKDFPKSTARWGRNE